MHQRASNKRCRYENSTHTVPHLYFYYVTALTYYDKENFSRIVFLLNIPVYCYITLIAKYSKKYFVNIWRGYWKIISLLQMSNSFSLEPWSFPVRRDLGCHNTPSQNWWELFGFNLVGLCYYVKSVATRVLYASLRLCSMKPANCLKICVALRYLQISNYYLKIF